METFQIIKWTLFPLLDVCKFIEESVKVKPDIIFTHHRDYLNIDHQIIYRATITAFHPQIGDDAEKGSLNFRRSIYISKNMKKGDVLTQNNLRIIRPGLGLPPKYYDTVLGRKVKNDLKKGTALKWELIS